MTTLTYRAYQVTAPKQEAELVSLTEASLPEGDLTVRVRHSSLNYKDGLAMTGKPGVVRPHVRHRPRRYGRRSGWWLRPR